MEKNDKNKETLLTSYRREFKLKVIKWCRKHGNNKASTARHFKVDRKRVREWIKDEQKIKGSKLHTRKIKSGKKALYPEAEKCLHAEFMKLRGEGQVVKRWWFNSKMKLLVAEKYPESNDIFKHSDQWFQRFCKRYSVSLRRKTHRAQIQPIELIQEISKLHKHLLQVRGNGVYLDKDIANMDQTPLPFVLDDGTTYDTTGAKDDSFASGPSGLNKRQCTVQLTVFGDRVPRVRPLLIFRGQGLRIKDEEKRQYDKRVTVEFQPKAWCDEAMMVKWICAQWGNIIKNPPTPGSDGKILVADMHRAQQTERVKRLLGRTKTMLVNVPAGCTSFVQVLDVCVKKPFKDYVRQQSEKHLNDNLDRYRAGKIKISERRILLSKWCGDAWARLDPEMIKRGFKKCGITTNTDGSENDLVSIGHLPDYQMPTDFEDEYVLEDDSDQEEGYVLDMDDSDSDTHSDSDSDSDTSDDSLLSVSDFADH